MVDAEPSTAAPEQKATDTDIKAAKAARKRETKRQNVLKTIREDGTRVPVEERHELRNEARIQRERLEEGEELRWETETVEKMVSHSLERARMPSK